MPEETPKGHTLIGPVSAMGAMVFFTTNDTIIKYFSDTYALHQLVFARCSIAITLIVAGVLIFGDGWASLKTHRLPAHILRGTLVVMANVAFFLAVAAMPLGEAVAIFFVGPLLITVFAALFLKEHVERLRHGHQPRRAAGREQRRAIFRRASRRGFCPFASHR